MSIRRRLFVSNLLMVLVPLLVIFCAGGLLINVGNYPNSLQVASSTGFDEAVQKMEELLVDVDGDRLLRDVDYRGDFLSLANEYGFHLQATRNETVVFTNLDSNDVAISESLGINLNQQPQAFPVVTHYIAISTFAWPISDEGGTIYLTALYSGGINDIGAIVAKWKIWPSIGILIFSAIVVIIMNILLSTRMITKIMVPVNKLIQGAKRIKQGDLSENIYYSGEDELSQVCDSFNEMQVRLRDNIEKNITHERRQREMIASISHDLKTPLTAIKGYVKGLKDGVARTEEKRQDYLDVVYQKTSEMESQIDKLFLYAKMETGHIPLCSLRTCLNKYLAAYLDARKGDFENRGAMLLFQDTSQELFAQVDQGQMDKVLENIMENSMKYAAGENLVITVSLLAEHNTAVIKVRDNGTGVPVEYLPRLFDSFYRVDEARVNSSEGSGLGLSIAKYVVERHGGKIYAENKNGLVIVLELPMEMEEI